MAVYDFYGNVIEEASAVHIDTLKIKYPSYTDDQLLAAAITLAKEQGKDTKIIWDGSAIHFSGHTTHVCDGFGGIDFNGSKIYMPDYTGDPILSIIPANAADLTIQASDIYDTYTTAESLKGKIFKINEAKAGHSDMCLGYRYGDSSEVTLYAAPLIKASENGHYETGDLYLVPESGTVTCYNVHKYSAVRFEVCNATVITSPTENATVLVDCWRSNVHVHDFVLEGQSETTEFYWGIFVFTACCDIEVDHISGIAPVKRSYTSGYFLAFRSNSFCYLHDIFVGDSTSWGAIGCRYIAETTFERCYLNRWDCHFAQFGTNVARNCVFNEILYGLGNGNLIFEHCTIIRNVNPVNVVSLVYMRSDCPGVYDGNIIIRDCEFIIGSLPASLIRIWLDNSANAKTANSAVSGSPEKLRLLENCQLPDGIHSVIKTGTTIAADRNMFNNLSYKIKNTNISCMDAVISAESGNEVKTVEIDGCTISGDTIKSLVCNLKVTDCELANITADVTIPNLVATGNVFSGTQAVSNFTAYALSGNIAADMASVNKHS